MQNIAMKMLWVSSNSYLFVCCLMYLCIDKSTAYSYYANATCQEVKCAANAICIPRGPSSCSCVCPYQLSHKAGFGCQQPECREDNDCRRDHYCNSNGFCVNLCLGACGFNAICKVSAKKIVSCYCDSGFTGDPLIACKPQMKENECTKVDCGQNSVCESRLAGRAICLCKSGFLRNSYGDCIHECEVDTQCGDNAYCLNYRCESICKQCGLGAICTGSSGPHQAKCECSPSYVGDPYKKCEPECYTDEECPISKPLCRSNQCYDPCAHSCGINANCTMYRKAAICKCPPGFTGDALNRCDPVSSEDPCEVNPCGKNALCTSGVTNSGLCAICECPPGMKGNPNIECKMGNCNNNADCFVNEICQNYTCIQLCDSSFVCGKNANCTIKEHRAICTCAEGFHGDPVTECFAKKYEPVYL